MINSFLLKEYEKELIALRRHFHQYPELSNEEFKTSQYIADYLFNCGLEVYKNLAGTGVIGVLKGTKKGEGPTIGIRADMDALPIREETNVSYNSKNNSKMHACGHDGHMAVVLVAAKILTSLKDQLQGNVVFIFQPAEENLPEGGAKRLIKEGKDIFSSLTAIFGFHFWPALESGKIAVSKSPMMAAGDIFEVFFYGKGAHGANPHQSSDVLLMTSNSVLSLSSIFSRSIEPGNPAVLSVGIIEGGKSPNILPEEARIKGTTRYLTDELKNFIPNKIDSVLEGVCKSYNGRYKLDYTHGYPVLCSSPQMVDIVRKCAGKVFGSANVIEPERSSMASEDFAVYLQDIPGCFFWVGSQNINEGINYSLHNPVFDLDESQLIKAVEVFIRISVHFLLKE